MSAPINRRAVISVGAGFAAAAAVPAPAATPERPNILWLVSEDNNPFIHAYGDRTARTPNIDALAAKGILFRNAYSNAPVCAPSRFAILTGVYPQSCAPANHMRASAKVAGVLDTYPELMRRAGYWCSNNAKTDYNCDVDPAKIWDQQGSSAHWRNRAAGQPFMAVFNHETSHESQLFQRTPGPVTGDHVRVPSYLPDTPAIRDDYASYYNLIEKVDGQIAVRLKELADSGLADDTIVFYYSDNGGVLPRSKRYCYDEGLRVALIVYVPPKWRHLSPVGPGTTVDTPVSLIDLAPTILSLAGAAQPAQMAGKALLGRRIGKPQRYAFGMRNRMDERLDFVRTLTDGRWRYIRNYMPHRPWGMHGAFEWLAKGYQDWEAQYRAGKLNAVQARFFGTKPFEELYDLTADPDQVVNLASKRPVELARLSKALDAHMVEINDNGFIPEGMDAEGWVASRDRRRYPLVRLMALGRIAAAGRTDGVSTLRAALADENPIVRYWGATGLLILGDTAEETKADLARIVATDPAPHVRVIAAEASARQGDEGAVAMLGSLAGPQQSWQVRLAALNALTLIGERSRSQLAAIDAAANEEESEYLRSAGRYLSAVLSGKYQPSYPVFQLERLSRAAGGKA